MKSEDIDPLYSAFAANWAKMSHNRAHIQNNVYKIVEIEKDILSMS